MSLTINGPNNSLDDTNGNEALKVTATASAINEYTAVNGAAGSGPRLDASGGDTDISPEIRAKGVGTVIVQANVANANVVGGLPVIHRIDVADAATGNVDVTLTHKSRIINAWVVKTAGAGGASDTITVNNGATAITDAMSINVADKVIVRAGQIDDASHEIAAAGTLRIVRTKVSAANVACTVYVEAIRVV